MAARSDFFNAKLPRQYKRMLAMEEANGWIKNSQERNTVKKLFIQAHANHVSYKMKRNSTEHRDASDGE